MAGALLDGGVGVGPLVSKVIEPIGSAFREVEEAYVGDAILKIGEELFGSEATPAAPP